MVLLRTALALAATTLLLASASYATPAGPIPYYGPNGETCYVFQSGLDVEYWQESNGIANLQRFATDDYDADNRLGDLSAFMIVCNGGL